MNKRFRLLFSAVLAFSLAFAGLALAHTAPWDDGVVDSSKEIHGHKHANHGGDTGHLPARSNDTELVSKLKLKNVVAEKIADVGVHKGFAYLAAWGVVTCKYNGVHVVNVKNPAAPREVSFIGSKEGSYPGEGIQALSVSSAAFTGDILVSNNEKCNEKNGFGGMNIYDVTKPTAPTPLYEGFGDDAVTGTGKKDAHEIHSVFAWDAGSKVYAAMVDNEEQADVDIVDITNPRKPKLIAEYDLAEMFPTITQPGMTEVFLHDMTVKNLGTASAPQWVMLANYWDAGYVLLNVNNPVKPKYMADSDYAAVDPEAAESGLAVPPEGNGHQGEFTADNEYIIGTDEDFDPYKLKATDDEGEPFDGTIGINFPPGTTLPSDLVYVGQACGSVPASTGDQLALVARGTCFFTDKQTNIEAAGYEGMIVFNNEEGSTPVCNGLINMAVEGTKPSFFVGRQTAFDFMDAPYDEALCKDGDLNTQPVPATVGQVFEDAVNISSYFDGWGYVHLFDADTMESLDTYAIPEAHDPSKFDKFGDLSVHEVAVSEKDPTLAYYAYYSGGFRATRIVDGKLQEVASFIDTNGSNLWGVEVFQSGGQEYVATSDRDHGLYIFKTTGSAAPRTP